MHHQIQVDTSVRGDKAGLTTRRNIYTCTKIPENLNSDIYIQAELLIIPPNAFVLALN